MHKHRFETIGTTFEITIWDQLETSLIDQHFTACVDTCAKFDALYSRFKPNSLVTNLSTVTGVHEVPNELVVMLRLYQKLFLATDGLITPTIGFALADTGYDATYSLTEQATIRSVPLLPESLTIIDDTHIELHTPTLFDLGALGKGYLIDQLHELLTEAGTQRFLIDGSGDIRYHGSQEPITAGLEHPHDTTQAIGVLQHHEGALCASAINRRSWDNNRNHYLNPHNNQSPTDIIATWVQAKTAAVADGLSSALFFAAPEKLHEFDFEYLILNQSLQPKRSAGFKAELF